MAVDARRAGAPTVLEARPHLCDQNGAESIFWSRTSGARLYLAIDIAPGVRLRSGGRALYGKRAGAGASWPWMASALGPAPRGRGLSTTLGAQNLTPPEVSGLIAVASGLF
jgi:hypothetical protein